MKIKEQTRKLAAGSSKHCFKVVDGTDEVSSKHWFKVVDGTDDKFKNIGLRLWMELTISNNIRQGDVETWFEEFFEVYDVST
ncbi:chlorohydrolase [Streptococcus pneumoniae]|uniref:hypothetical protein n=1 Tax=Streptococcus pneumoniae TaxID=1313 RepID=UPI000B710A6C|nr:hypothetical protein [Streptococcus pneumoniae]SNK45391.1 chlorohydrolase [Streptococcus pneumoniae]